MCKELIYVNKSAYTVTNQSIFSSLFRRVRKIAKCDYRLRHVCLFVCSSAGNSFCVCEKMSRNIIGRDRPQTTIIRMRISCWIPKATNTHSQYVTYCSSTTKMVARTLVFITLYVHFKLNYNHPDVFKDGIQGITSVKHTIYILFVEFTRATCFDLV